MVQLEFGSTMPHPCSFSWHVLIITYAPGWDNDLHFTAKAQRKAKQWPKGSIRIFFFFFLFGSSQARAQVGAAAAGLCHSHSNSGSQPHLHLTPQLTGMPDP